MSVENVLSSISEMNTYTNELTEYVNQLKSRSNKDMQVHFADLRKFDVETVRENDIFYIGDATEMLIPAYLGKVEDFGVISPTNKKPIFHNRYVIPIKDTNGKILNLVGYSKDADERYVYGTAKYYRRRETMYGLENLHLAYELGYAILTEGITDALCLRNLGFKNTFANCGTHNSDFIIKQLNRCRHGIIKVPDRDAAGVRANNKWKCLRSVTLNAYIKYKDIDEMCKDSDDMKDLVKEYIDNCIEWLVSGTHNGLSSINEVVTIT